jgi:tripartite-type tricarboxylate transporter receptor subunit TctC
MQCTRLRRPARRAATLAAAALAAAAPAILAPAAADDVADFFRGRQITYVIQAGAGGYYGLNGRLIADHMGRFIPGNPSIVPQHMPGAGGIKAANYAYNVAPRDGAVMAMLSADLAVVQKMKPDAVKYDAAKFNWIGSIYPFNQVLAIYHTANVKTLDDLKRKEVVLGHTGRSSHNFMQGVLLTRYFGLKLKNVAGYRGGSDLYLAMERGEVHGRIGSWSSLVATKGDWLARKKIVALMQSGIERSAELGDVPTMVELAPSDEVREMFLFLSGGAPVGWSACLPPNVPAARVAALRTAWEALLRDPAFKADVIRRKAAIDARTAAQVEAAIKRTLATPDAIVKKILAASKG